MNLSILVPALAASPDQLDTDQLARAGKGMVETHQLKRPVETPQRASG